MTVRKIFLFLFLLPLIFTGCLLFDGRDSGHDEDELTELALLDSLLTGRTAVLQNASLIFKNDRSDCANPGIEIHIEAGGSEVLEMPATATGAESAAVSLGAGTYTFELHCVPTVSTLKQITATLQGGLSYELHAEPDNSTVELNVL
ncbi:MAG: hypothetical protein RIF32_11390 [Leptospirales bacterium]|jgi:hypothetical protein